MFKVGDHVLCNFGKVASGIRWPCKVEKIHNDKTVSISGSSIMGIQETNRVPINEIETDNHANPADQKIQNNYQHTGR